MGFRGRAFLHRGEVRLCFFVYALSLWVRVSRIGNCNADVRYMRLHVHDHAPVRLVLQGRAYRCVRDSSARQTLFRSGTVEGGRCVVHAVRACSLEPFFVSRSALSMARRRSVGRSHD